MSDDGAWFVYRRQPGKISALPIRRQGWTALGATVTLPLGIAVAVRLGGAPLWAALIATLVTTAMSLWLLFRLVLTRGREG